MNNKRPESQEQTNDPDLKDGFGKQNKMNLVAQKTLELVDRHGIDAVTFSRISQITKISRPWLYKYIGNSKEDLIAFAIAHFGRIFAILEARKKPTNETEWLNSVEGGFDHLLNISDEHPWAISIYMHYRGTKTPIGYRIDQTESEHGQISLSEMKSCLKLSENELHSFLEPLRAVRMGLVHHYSTDKNKSVVKMQMKSFLHWLLMQIIKRDPR